MSKITYITKNNKIVLICNNMDDFGTFPIIIWQFPYETLESDLKKKLFNNLMYYLCTEEEKVKYIDFVTSFSRLLVVLLS